ncbi:MAG: glycosyltransferase family 4 protein [Chloroflexi bacterium]|nr:glycosyltransferase family 4 protein [Chloroflexota bacterium]
MNVISVGLAASVLTSNTDDARQRQMRYAQAIGSLRLILPREGGTGAKPVALSESLTVYTASKPNWPLFIPNAVRVAGEIARREKVDLVTVQDPFVGGLIGTILKKRYGWPLEIQSHSTFFDNPHWIAERPMIHGALNVVGKQVLRQANGWRVSNLHQQERYLALGLPADRVWRIPIPVNFQNFQKPITAEQRQAIRAGWGVTDDAPVFLWAGRPVPFKNLPTLLRASRTVFDQMPQTRLVLIGDFSRAPQLIALADSLKLGENVIWPGPVPHADIPATFRAADVYVLPSWYEGLARVLMEAAISELPIVAARSPGVWDAVAHGETGFLSEPGDSAALAEHMLALAADLPRARAMGQRGAQFAAQEFDSQKLQAAIIRAWQMCATR